MFKFVYGKADKFKQVVNAIAKISDVGYLEIFPDGVRLWTISPDRVSMASIYIPSQSLDSLTYGEKEIRVQLDINELDRILRRATKNDNVTIEYDKVMQTMAVTLLDRKSGMERKFDLSPVVTAEERYREIRMEPQTEFSVEPEDLKVLVGDVKLVGDIVTFSSSDERITVSARGEEREYVWHMSLNDPLLSLRVESPSEASYSRAVLETAIKPTAAASQINLGYSTNYPMKIWFELQSGENMIIYIAPAGE